MLVFKSAQVIEHCVMFAFLFVQTIFHLVSTYILSFKPLAIQPSLCRTWLESQKTRFLWHGSASFYINLKFQDNSWSLLLNFTLSKNLNLLIHHL